MVYFVGAGPGDKELLTIKGLKLLSSADCVIYAGSLVNPELLQYTKSGCAVYNSAVMTLEDVFDVIKKYEGKGAVTVRLHTGDPSIYGAVKEQMDLLDEHSISYGVVPGVSSFLGAAASLKAEYTLPGVSQTVILTRMEGKTPVPPKQSIENLASTQATMVVFLSAGMLKELTAKLLAGGFSEDTPAAIVYKATWPEEILITTTVKDLANSAAAHGITKTALVLVGRFLGSAYERSMLYHPEFSHGFRDGGVAQNSNDAAGERNG